MFSLGLTAPVGPGKVKAVYYRVNRADTTVGVGAAAVTSKNDNSKFGLGYDYALSKRTGMYFDLGVASASDGRTKNNAYAFGVKHTF
jgi:predicted porin